MLACVNCAELNQSCDEMHRWHWPIIGRPIIGA